MYVDLSCCSKVFAVSKNISGLLEDLYSNRKYLNNIQLTHIKKSKSAEAKLERELDEFQIYRYQTAKHYFNNMPEEVKTIPFDEAIASTEQFEETYWSAQYFAPSPASPEFEMDAPEPYQLKPTSPKAKPPSPKAKPPSPKAAEPPSPKILAQLKKKLAGRLKRSGRLKSPTKPKQLSPPKTLHAAFRKLPSPTKQKPKPPSPTDIINKLQAMMEPQVKRPPKKPQTPKKKITLKIPARKKPAQPMPAQRKPVPPIPVQAPTVPRISNVPKRVRDPALQKLVGKKKVPHPHKIVQPSLQKRIVRGIQSGMKMLKGIVPGGAAQVLGVQPVPKTITLGTRRRLQRRGRHSQYQVGLHLSHPSISTQEMAQILRNDRLRKDPTLRFKDGKSKRIGKYVQLITRKNTIFINVKRGASKRVIRLLLKHLKAFTAQTVQAELFAIDSEFKKAFISRQGLIAIDIGRFYGMLRPYLTEDNNEFLLEFESDGALGGSLVSGIHGDYLYDF